MTTVVSEFWSALSLLYFLPTDIFDEADEIAVPQAAKKSIASKPKPSADNVVSRHILRLRATSRMLQFSMAEECSEDEIVEA